MNDQKEAMLRYARMMQAHVITPEEERRCAELQRNVPPEKRYTMSQLQNSYWAMQEPSESVKAFVAENLKPERTSLVARAKAWISRWVK